MAAIRTTCPTCHLSIELAPGAVELRAKAFGSTPGYAFACPVCATAALLPADPFTLAIITAAQVTLQPVHPERHSGGPAFTFDDVLDFHQLLQRPDWFTQLVTTASEA